MNKKSKKEAIEAICYQNFMNARDNKEKMEEYASKMNLSLKLFLLYAQQYIEKNVSKPDYVELLDTIFNLNDDEVIKLFEQIKVNSKYLKNNLFSYFMNYRPYQYYVYPENLTKLKNKLTNYEIYLYRKLDPCRVTKKIDLEYYKNVVREFINSEYSLKRFCFNKNINPKFFNNYVSQIKQAEKNDNTENLYNQYTQSIAMKEYNKSKNLNNNILEILNAIKENPDFSLVDFCLISNYDVNEIIEKVDTLLDHEDAKLVRIVLKTIRNIDQLSEERLSIIFRDDYTFNINNELININEEDKYAIINYLYINNIPICIHTFKAMCTKIYSDRKNNIVKTK